MISLGVDIGGTSVKIAAREQGKTLWTGQSPFYARPDTAALLKAIAQAADGCASNADVIGLCVPGLFDKPRRMITLSVNASGVMDVVLDDLNGDPLRSW